MNHRKCPRLPYIIIGAPTVIRAGLAIPEQSAVGKNDLIKSPHRIAVLGREHVNRDHVAGLEGSSVPAHQGNRGRTAELYRPMCRASLIILGVEKNQSVGICPYIFRYDGPLHDDGLTHIVCGSSVMREESSTNR